MNNFKEIEDRVLFELEKTKFKDLLTLKDLVLVSQYSESTIRRAIAQKRLIPMRQMKGGRLTFPREADMNCLRGGAE